MEVTKSILFQQELLQATRITRASALCLDAFPINHSIESFTFLVQAQADENERHN